MADLEGLKKSLKVSQSESRRWFNEVTKRILALEGKAPFPLGPGETLEVLRRDYFRLAELLLRAQEKQTVKVREAVREAAESLVLDAMLFHLNFFYPHLFGLAERRAFQHLLSRMKKTFAAKNADYGGAFRFWGIPGLLVRIGDKYLRLEQLAGRGRKRQVKDERIPDTALDLANYSIMLLMLLAEGRPLKFGE